MFQVLIESSPHAAPRTPRWTLMSAFVHATLLAAAVAATTHGVRELRTEPMRSESLAYVRVETAPVSRTEHHARTSSDWVQPDFSHVPVPDVPAVDVSAASGDKLFPEDYWRHERGLTIPRSAATLPGGVYSAQLVDRPVIPDPNNASPEYPRMLRAAGVEGEVLARFVVDTTGRVEPSSISVMQTTHALFAESVRGWLLRTRYRPAEASGRPVRQLVEQRIGFTLER